MTAEEQVTVSVTPSPQNEANTFHTDATDNNETVYVTILNEEFADHDFSVYVVDDDEYSTVDVCDSTRETAQLSSDSTILYEWASQSGLKFMALNVCGLKSKILYPDFVNFVNQFDVISFFFEFIPIIQFKSSNTFF